MAEYIERETARPDAFCVGVSCQECPFLKDPIYGGCRVNDFIAALPSADVAPMKRGRNICDEVHGHCEFKCSLCGCELSSVYGGKNDCGMDGGYFNYCPNCGAKMDEDARHAETDR